MNKALRLCYRSSVRFEALRCQSAVPTTRCLAVAVCPARSLASTSTPPASRMPVRRRVQTQLGSRGYSTREGTIGKGEEGVVDEVAREREILQAPEHLNEKEREIWALLHEQLEATSLEVCSNFLPPPILYDILLVLVSEREKETDRD